MSKASITDIAAVHGKLNSLYTEILNTLNNAMDSEDEDTRLMAVSLASPAMLTSVTNWLKHNGVSADSDSVQETNELKEALAKKRKRVANVLVFNEFKDSYGS